MTSLSQNNSFTAALGLPFEKKHEYNNNNNNNQAFYSHVSWGRLEMKSHEKKNKSEKEEKNKGR
jgi:hypothetical protein